MTFDEMTQNLTVLSPNAVAATRVRLQDSMSLITPPAIREKLKEALYRLGPDVGYSEGCAIRMVVWDAGTLAGEVGYDDLASNLHSICDTFSAYLREIDDAIEKAEIEGHLDDPFTPIRQRLLSVLDNRPSAIVPFIAKKIAVASAWILPDMSVNAIEEVVADLQNLGGRADHFGRSDIADELEEIAKLLCAELPAPPEAPEVSGCEVYIHFLSGAISGDCSGCSATEVANALVAVAETLQRCDETPECVGFDCGGTYTEKGDTDGYND